MFAASAGMQVLGAVTKGNNDQSVYNQKMRAADAQIDAIKKSTIFTYAQDNLQAQQVQNRAAVEEGGMRLKDDATSGEAAASAADGGVTGNSVTALMRSFKVATGTEIANTEADAQGQIGQTQANQKGAYVSANNQIAGVVAGEPLDPSNAIMGHYFDAALGIGKSFMDGTTKVGASNNTGGLFGSGGFLGTGRQFG
jgi:hypothetical protein